MNASMKNYTFDSLEEKKNIEVYLTTNVRMRVTKRRGKDKETGNKRCSSAHYSLPALTKTAGKLPVPPLNEFSMHAVHTTSKITAVRAEQ